MKTSVGPLWNDKARFARFVGANTGMSEFPIQHIGSGFTFLAADTVCLVTARHVIENNHANPGAVVLPPLDGSLKWWSSDACVHLDATEPYQDDPTFADLALYSMHTPSGLRSCLNNYDYLTIPKDLRIAQGAPLVAFGYPHRNAELDVEERFFIGERVDIEGRYVGPTRHRGLHTFESERLATIDPDGMSGGPVAARLTDGSYILAGVIVQGNSASQKLHFVTSEWVIGALDFGLPNLFRTRTKFHGDRVDIEDL